MPRITVLIQNILYDQSFSYANCYTNTCLTHQTWIFTFFEEKYVWSLKKEKKRRYRMNFNSNNQECINRVMEETTLVPVGNHRCIYISRRELIKSFIERIVDGREESWGSNTWKTFCGEIWRRSWLSSIANCTTYRESIGSQYFISVIIFLLKVASLPLPTERRCSINFS